MSSSPYENTRLERIKENRERMQKLGLFELSSKLTSLPSSASTRGRKRRNPILASSNSTPLPPPGPARRSSRLQNVTPVSYSESVKAKTERTLKDKEIRLEAGSMPEVYTEEHEKLLGSTERSWTLFVDGCGSDGKRIYDPIKGKSCHQCRQKTLGYRTYCSNCEMARGQFCGDCLYMRYGEHILEARENKNWICPVCRGICNCSLCRQAKGWLPTGPMYKKISSLGYKSVAHYLIQTQRSKEDATNHQSSAKRSLPFPDTEASLEKSTDLVTIEISIHPQPHEMKYGEKMSGSGDVATHQRTNRSLQFYSEQEDVTDLDQEADKGHQSSPKRSLPFPATEASLVKSTDLVTIEISIYPQPHEMKDGEKMSGSGDVATHQRMNRSLQFYSEQEDVTDLDHEADKGHGILEYASQGARRASADGCPREPSPPIPSIQTSPENLEISEVNHGLNGQLDNVIKHTNTEEAKNQTAMQLKKEDLAANINTASASIRKRKPNSDNEPNLDSISTRLRRRRQMVKCIGV